MTSACPTAAFIIYQVSFVLKTPVVRLSVHFLAIRHHMMAHHRRTLNHWRHCVREILTVLGNLLRHQGPELPKPTDTKCEYIRSTSSNERTPSRHTKQRRRKSRRPTVVIVRPCCCRDCTCWARERLQASNILQEMPVPELDGTGHGVRAFATTGCPNTSYRNWS